MTATKLSWGKRLSTSNYFSRGKRSTPGVDRAIHTVCNGPVKKKFILWW